jgi:hypothetical protein
VRSLCEQVITEKLISKKTRNNQMNNNFSEKKYNAFKDSNFWAALIISLIFISAQSILISVLTMSFHLVLLPGLMSMIIWVNWIIFKKGKKWSLIVGFLIALVFGIIEIFISAKIESKRMDARIEKFMGEYRKRLNLETHNQLQEAQK